MTDKTKRDIAIETVKRLLNELPGQLADINFSENKYEYVINVVPRSEHHCKFWMGFSTYGTYDLCFGHGMAFEELLLDEFPPKDVINAILRGNVQETTWALFGIFFKRVGMLTLESGIVLTDNILFLPIGFLSKKRCKKLVYQAYL